MSMRQWKHTGFSVYTDSYMDLGVFEDKPEAEIDIKEGTNRMEWLILY